MRWQGLDRARDLGGLPVPSGITRRAAVICAGSLDDADASVFVDLRAAGIRTFVDLSSTVEAPAVPTALRRQPSLTEGVFHVRVPIDDASDALWQLLQRTEGGAPAAWLRILIDVAPERLASAIAAIADAPGGVLLHASAGRDRTGIVAAVLLSLAGVAPDVIAAQLVPDEHVDDHPGSRAALRHARTLAAERSAVELALSGFDAGEWLLRHGLSAPQLERLRERLVDRF